MKYNIDNSFRRDMGFSLTGSNILDSAIALNNFLKSLPIHLYRNIDFKTTGALIGAMFCSILANNIPNAVVNPIEKGYPDIIPQTGLTATEKDLRNYPEGLEIKCTIGNIKRGAKLGAGENRINHLSGITWQAHHRDGKQLLGLIWDFANLHNNFLFPAITAAYFADNLETSDWGKISGTTGRNTKVAGMIKSGKIKMSKNCILIIDDKTYIDKYTSLLT